MIQRVVRKNKCEWKKRMRKVEENISWRVKRVKGEKIKKVEREGEKTESEWIDKDALGSKDRERITIEVPVIGNVNVDDVDYVDLDEADGDGDDF